LQLSFLLCIGPLARLTPRFKRLLYNRRHRGVATLLVALVHSVLVTLRYHGFGALNPLLSLLVSNPRYDSLAGFSLEAPFVGGPRPNAEQQQKPACLRG
jgi:methionine sulfoxide reductase heme-binding subunit